MAPGPDSSCSMTFLGRRLTPRRRQWTVVSGKVSTEDNRGGCLEGHGMPCPDKDNAAACRVFTSC